jgi:hypothetical protein
MAESALGPSGSGSVVLDLGPGIGALVLHTRPELDGQEIQISPQDDAAAGPATHSRVRQRHTAGGVRYAAVYPDLAAGLYRLWHTRDDTELVVTITGGTVATARWPG